MKFIGSMTRGVNVNEIVVVPEGEFWRGSLYPPEGNTSVQQIEINGIKYYPTQLREFSTHFIFASGTIIKAGGGAFSLSVLRFSEV